MKALLLLQYPKQFDLIGQRLAMLARDALWLAQLNLQLCFNISNSLTYYCSLTGSIA